MNERINESVRGKLTRSLTHSLTPLFSLIYSLILLLSTLCSASTPLVKALITVTNVPVTSNTLTINGAVRNWTNFQSSSTFLTNLAGVNQAKTNCYNQIAGNSYQSPSLLLHDNGTNSFYLLGIALSASQAGNWCSIVLSTNSGDTNLTSLELPFDRLDPTNRTNNASQLVYGENLYSTNSYATNALAMQNFLSLGVGSGGGVQTVTAPKVFASLSGTVGNFTNGYWTNAILDRATVTNLSSPGPGGVSSLQFGTNALAWSALTVALGVNSTASNSASTAVGNQARALLGSDTALGTGAAALGGSSLALGTGAQAPGSGSIAIGSGVNGIGASGIGIGNGDTTANVNGVAVGAGANGSGAQGIAIGYYPTASATDTVAIGDGAGATFKTSVALGAGAATTITNQIRLGTAAEVVSIPGRLEAATQTNGVFTGSNTWTGDLAYTPVTVTSMAAGVNAAVPGTNVLLEITGTPGAAWSIAGITGGRAGRVLTIFNSTGYAMTVANESGSEPSPGNRIKTLLNTDLVTGTNSVVDLFYSGALSRWVLHNHYP
jgi:hypothetical protein